jgi:hypothetical protein
MNISNETRFIKANKIFVIIIVFNLLLLVFSSFLNNSFLFENSYLLFLIQYVFCWLIVLFFFNNKIDLNNFFIPSFVSFNYLSLNFVLGNYFTTRGVGLGFVDEYHSALHNSNNWTFITIFLLLCNLCVFLVSILSFRRFIRLNNLNLIVDVNYYLKSKNLKYIAVLTFFLTIIFSNLELDLSFLGGSGNFNYPLMLSSSILFLFSIQNFPKIFRYALYCLLLSIFLLASFESKREIIYVLFLILLYEFSISSILFSLNKKIILYFLIGFSSFVLIIISSSILRGYGNYSVESIKDLLYSIYLYSKEDFFWDALVTNFELNASFSNAFISISYTLDGLINYQYGASFSKIFFLTVPRSIFPEKPESIMEIYTSTFLSSFSRKGGSAPTTIFGEFFINFYLFSIPLLFIFFYFWDKLLIPSSIRNLTLSRNILSTSRIFLLVTSIQLVRGSGLDLYVLYLIIGLPVLFIFHKNKFKFNV